MPKQSGFTLIELLIVIAIIAILAAILFPVFAKVREKARQASCSSNEKQLGLAFMQYYQDYDERFPCGVTPNLVGSAGYALGQGWGGQVYPYVKSTGVYNCPDDTTQNYVNAAVTPPIISYPVSYAVNANVVRNDVRTLNQAVSVLNAPAKTVLLCEQTGDPAPITDPQERGGQGFPPGICNDSSYVSAVTVGYFYPPFASVYPVRESNCSQGGLETGQLGSKPYGLALGPSPTGWHTDGSNYVLCDGHVKWLRGGAVSGGDLIPTMTENTPEDTTNTYDAKAAGTAVSAFAATFSPI